MNARAWKWRCVRCSTEYILPMNELPPEYCNKRQGWTLCGGSEFIKIGESELDKPDSWDAAAIS
jgi:hypothetical protein